MLRWVVLNTENNNNNNNHGHQHGKVQSSDTDGVGIRHLVSPPPSFPSWIVRFPTNGLHGKVERCEERGNVAEKHGECDVIKAGAAKC